MEVDKGSILESAKLCNKLFQLKNDAILTDITIICHGKVISAHKCILAASSQFFKTLFCQDSTYMCGYFQSCDFTDQLDYSSAEFLEKIIDFMYSRTIVINDLNVAEIAKLAFFFVVDDLLETCYQFLNSTVTLKNCIDIYVRLNQIAEFRAGPIYLQSLDTSIDMLKVPYTLIQSRFHDVYIQSEALVNTRPEDLMHLLSKGVAKSCTIDGVVKFVIKWLQKHPRDNAFEVASVMLDNALEKSRVPMPGAVSSWINVTGMYDKIEAVLGGSAISQAYQTGLLTKMSAILEQLESHDYSAIKEKEMSGETEVTCKEEEKEMLDMDKESLKTEQSLTESNSQESTCMTTQKPEKSKEESSKEKPDNDKNVCDCGKSRKDCKKCKKALNQQYRLRKKLKAHGDVKRVSCKVCKLEFRAKYHLDRHNKRVHSKKGTLSLKVQVNKTKSARKSSKGGNLKGLKKNDIKGLKNNDIKEEIIAEDQTVANNLHKPGVPHPKVGSAANRKRGRKPKVLAVDKNSLSAKNDDNSREVDRGKSGDVKDEYCHAVKERLKDGSDVEDNHDTDSTVENEPVDIANVSDQTNGFDAENNFINSGVTITEIDRFLGNLMDLQCFECKKIFKDKYALKAHLRCHNDLRPYKCNTCDTTFKRSSHLRRHERIHSGQKPFECILCKAKFVDNAGLKSHLKTHSDDRPFSCEVCQRGYKDEKDFIRHSLMHSHTERLFKCEVCDKRFTRKYHLTRHNLIHLGKIPRKHKCPHCDESFSRTKALQKHLPVHNGEPGVMEIYEAPVTSHTCEVCGYTFTDVNNLIRHIRVHTGEKPFACDICGKAFSQKGQLNIHKLTHGGTRQYQCEMCPKLFLTNSGLHKHRRQVHSNYRPYGCEFCGKQFLQKSDLRRHVPMHTGEKNYQCDICAQLFARKDKLVSHFKQEHMQELQ